MTKFFSFFIVLSSALILLVSFSLFLENQTKNTPDNKAKVDVSIYQDEKGNPKYAKGSCQDNSDCFTGGCSNEYCTSRKDLVSICIFSEDFPDKNVYSCGCIGGKCVWFKK